MQVLFDLPAFVTVLHRFLRLVFNLAERMFGIAYGLADDFERFRHDSSLVDGLPEADGDSGRSLIAPNLVRLAIAASCVRMIRPAFRSVIQNLFQAVSVLADELSGRRSTNKCFSTLRNSFCGPRELI